MLQTRPGRPDMGSPCPCLPGARAQFVSLAYRRSAPGDLQRYSSKGGGDLLPRSGAPFRKGARPYCPDRDGAARCGAQVPGRKDASHGAGGRSRDRALRFRRGAALQASGSGLRGGAWRAGRADRRGSGAGAAQAVSQADQASAVCLVRAWASFRRACIGRRRRGCSAPRRRLALTPQPGLGLRQSTVVPCVSAGPASTRLLMGALGSVLSAGRSRERAQWPVLCCLLCSSRRYGTATVG